MKKATKTRKPKKTKSVISTERKVLLALKPCDTLFLALEQAQLGDGLQAVARENRVPFRWAHLNQGMQRMNLGNVLRGMLARNEPVSVEGTRLGTVATKRAA